MTRDKKNILKKSLLTIFLWCCIILSYFIIPPSISTAQAYDPIDATQYPLRFVLTDYYGNKNIVAFVYGGTPVLPDSPPGWYYAYDGSTNGFLSVSGINAAYHDPNGFVSQLQRLNQAQGTNYIQGIHTTQDNQSNAYNQTSIYNQQAAPSAPAAPTPIQPVTHVKIGGVDLGTVLKPIACPKGAECKIDWIGQYINILYNYGVGLAAFLAVIMVMVGGFIWLMSAGSPDRVSQGKEFITAAISGLVIALFSYTILNFINPNLVNLKPITISVPSVVTTTGTDYTPSAGGGGSTTGGGGTGTSSLAEDQMRNDLATHGVSFNAAPPVTTVTGGNGWSPDMVTTIDKLSTQIGGLEVTGGTDHGHPHDAADLRPSASLDGFIESSAANTRTVPQFGDTTNAQQYYVSGYGVFTHETSPQHWHFEYGRSF